MDANGANQVNVSNQSFNEDEPSWSPDGGSITYTAQNPSTNNVFDIHVMDANGANQVNVSNFNANSIDIDTDPTWSGPACGSASFPDVPPWVAPSVDWAHCAGHMAGYPDGTFQPNADITRAQVARLLYRVAGSPDVTELDGHGLSDVPPWVEDPVRWLVANDYMSGYPDKTFKPNLPITRGQVTRATFRVQGSVPGSPLHSFPDVPAWLTESVNWAANDPDGSGPAPALMAGYPNGTFGPGLNITRAQTVRLTCRANAAPGTC
jgi:hypothetical protein